MKKIIILVVILITLLFVFSVNAQSTPVEIVSSTFHVWGDIGGYYEIQNPNDPDEGLMVSFSNSYDVSASNPLNKNIVGPYGGPGAAYASSSANYFNTYVYASTEDSMVHGGAFTAATWVFKPVVSFSAFTVVYGSVDDGDAFGSVKGFLKDITTSQDLWNVDIGYGDLWNTDISTGDYLQVFTDEINHDFKSDHLYELSFWSGVGSNCDDEGAWMRTNDLSPVFVPETATIILLVSGIMGLISLRKMFKRHDG